MNDKNFSDIGKVEAIRQLFEMTELRQSDGMSFLCGENGSAVRISSGLWTEGVDFDLTYFPLKHLGYKCFIEAVGDIYANLGRPQSLSVRLGISSKLDYPQISELWQGICIAAQEHHINRADLDLIPSQNGLIISIVISGVTSPDVESERHAPASKDLICLSGNVGAAFLGMSLLEREKNRIEKEGSMIGKMNIDGFKMLIGSYLKPELNPDIVAQLSDSGIVPSCGYFVNRGLADAVMRLRRDTGLGVKIYTDKIPFEGNSFDAGRKLNIDPVSAALNGGEDCRLMFVIPLSEYESFRHDFQSFSIIGHMARPDVGTVIVTPDGAELPIHAQGWKDKEEEC